MVTVAVTGFSHSLSREGQSDDGHNVACDPATRGGRAGAIPGDARGAWGGLRQGQRASPVSVGGTGTGSGRAYSSKQLGVASSLGGGHGVVEVTSLSGVVVVDELNRAGCRANRVPAGSACLGVWVCETPHAERRCAVEWVACGRALAVDVADSQIAIVSRHVTCDGTLTAHVNGGRASHEVPPAFCLSSVVGGTREGIAMARSARGRRARARCELDRCDWAVVLSSSWLRR